ncbi:MAG: DUF4402 domain-containing protein [Rhodospirillales bacterium]
MTSSAMAADATASASAVVGAPIAITQAKGLSFGSFAPNATTAGSVVIGTDGSPTYNVVTQLSGATPSEGEFSVTGQGAAAISVAIPTSPVTLTNQDGAGTMTVASFTSDAGATPAFNGSGNFTLNVGATLTVAAGQNAGNYTGTYQVSVNYQ